MFDMNGSEVRLLTRFVEFLNIRKLLENPSEKRR